NLSIEKWIMGSNNCLNQLLIKQRFKFPIFCRGFAERLAHSVKNLELILQLARKNLLLNAPAKRNYQECVK
ncbi:MAG: hypothetical protein ACFFB3_14820, partial [Candidatus Hodarchaeota archaeon]